MPKHGKIKQKNVPEMGWCAYIHDNQRPAIISSESSSFIGGLFKISLLGNNDFYFILIFLNEIFSYSKFDVMSQHVIFDLAGGICLKELVSCLASVIYEKLAFQYCLFLVINENIPI